MRHYRGTIILLSVLVLLGVFVYFFELRNTDATPTQGEEMIFDFAEQQVRSVQVKTTDRLVRVAKSDDGEWRLTEPQPGPADRWRVLTVLWRLAPLRADQVVSETIADPAEYGLDRPQLELRLELVDGEDEALFVGNESPLGNAFYARAADSTRLYLINAALVTDLRKLTVEPPIAPTPTPEATETPAAEATPTP